MSSALDIILIPRALITIGCRGYILTLSSINVLIIIGVIDSTISNNLHIMLHHDIFVKHIRIFCIINTSMRRFRGPTLEQLYYKVLHKKIPLLYLKFETWEGNNEYIYEAAFSCINRVLSARAFASILSCKVSLGDKFAFISSN